LAAAGLFAQTGGGESSLIPEDIRRPGTGEAPRYPRDVVIGELGRGAASGDAYEYARRILLALLGDNRDSEYLSRLGSAAVKELLESIGGIQARKFRIGGGREEPDGSISFLVRFIGREQGIAGELYLRREEDAWYCDGLLLEEARNIPEPGSPYTYDFSPYERFF
jgi:hypothetical protein